MNDFDTCLKYEHSRQLGANEFYEELGYKDIKRCSWGDPEGRVLQKRGIDVLLDGIPVSEKFRDREWKDICIELYSDWEKGKDGSFIYSQAEELYYFNGHQFVIRLDMNKLRPLVFRWREHIHSHLTESQVRSLELKEPVDITLPGDIPAQLRSFSSTHKDRTWSSLCLLVEWRYVDDCVINDYTYESFENE